jgi:hypothetical protein
MAKEIQILVDDCIDVKSIKIIRDFLTDFFDKSNSFRGMYREVDDFFKEIGFNTYLVKYDSRMSKEQKNNALGSDFEEEKKRMNQDCFTYAERLHTLAKEKYKKFTTLSQKVQREGYQYTPSPAWKKAFGIGTKERYNKMITEIEPCLYWTMLKFSELILRLELGLELGLENEQLVSANSDSKNIKKLISLLELLPVTPEDKLLITITPDTQDDLAGRHIEESEIGPGIEYDGDYTRLLSTHEAGHRRHRRHTHRRHHSKHSHKSVKRSKKGKKIMKSHTRKRHTRARKQNRRRNRSRK